MSIPRWNFGGILPKVKKQNFIVVCKSHEGEIPWRYYTSAWDSEDAAERILVKSPWLTVIQVYQTTWGTE
jgi:hypothetical protein